MKCNYFIRLFIFAAILTFFFNLNVFAQDQGKTPSKQHFAVYIYPVSLITTILMLPDNDNQGDNYAVNKKKGDNDYFTNLYLTFEFIADPFSIILTPSYQGWNQHEYGYNEEGKLNHDRIGGDLGLRFYFSGSEKPTGFFIQATGGMYYLSRDIEYRNYKNASYRAVLYQAMGFLGYKYSVAYLTIGAGYNYYQDKRLSYYKDERKDLREEFLQRGFVFDIAFSLRVFPFGG